MADSTDRTGNSTPRFTGKLAIGDPLLRWLTDRRVHPALFGIAYALLFQSFRGVVTWWAGHLRTVGVTLGYLDTPAVYTNLLFGAVVTTFYVWLPRGISALFKDLFDHGVIGEPLPSTRKDKKKTYTHTSYVRALQKSFAQWWWYVGPLMFTIAATLVLILPQYLEDPHLVADRADPVSFVLTTLWVAVGLYFVLLGLSYCVLTIYWLSQLFNSFQMDVRPLHPDRAGGLSPLGNFALSLSYVIAFVGVILVVTPITRNYVVAGTWRFRWTTELLVGLALYALLAPVVFFAPLSVAHRAMKEAKDKLILQIARQFDQEYRKVRGALNGDVSKLEESSKVLKELQSLHDMTSKFPVWPFNVSSMTRFGTSYVAPVILAVAVDLISRLLQ
jgi:hypothetical protein